MTPTTTPALVPGGTYYLGVQDTSGGCTTYAIEVDFDLVTSIPGPFAFTQPAYAVTGTSAQLNGMATPNVLPATAWFQWGTSTLYGNQTPPVSVGTGSNVVYTASQISGLLPNVPYHFRLVVSNAVTVVYGFDQILDEANVVVWGANYAGQANVPAGLSNVVAIAGAYDHSLALKNNETAVGWGDNFYGAGDRAGRFEQSGGRGRRGILQPGIAKQRNRGRLGLGYLSWRRRDECAGRFE